MELAIAANKGLVSTNRIEDLIANFVRDQDTKESSRKLYERTLKQYFNYVEDEGLRLNEILRHNILQYKDDLLARGLSSLTVSSYLTVVRKFYEWAEANKLYPNVAKGVKTPSRKRQYRKQPLNTKQAKALLQHIKTTNKRDFAIVNLLIRTGLRTIEATGATIEDITYKGSKRVLLIKGKGRHDKDNFVILTDNAHKPLEDYLKERPQAQPQEPLFTSTSNNSRGEKLTTRTISKIVKEGLKAIGIDDKNYTAHSLRHTTAVNILRAKGSIEQAQKTLRHSNPSTTEAYTYTMDEERRLANSGEELIDKLF